MSSFTTTVYRHGVPASGFVELVDIVARTGLAEAEDAATVTISAHAMRGSRTPSF